MREIPYADFTMSAWPDQQLAGLRMEVDQFDYLRSYRSNGETYTAWLQRNAPGIRREYDRRQRERRREDQLVDRFHATERRCEVLRMRSEGMTLEQIGAALDVTRERARQLLIAGKSDPLAYAAFVFRSAF